MPESAEIGVGHLCVARGDHVCVLYSGWRERDSILASYLRRGIDAGDRCVCLLADPDPVIPSDIAASVDVRSTVASHHLDMFRSTDTSVRPGCFDLVDLIGLWEAVGAEATGDDRHSRVQFIGDMSCIRDVPGTAELALFECELTKLLSRHPHFIVCLYDLDRFGGAFLVDLIRMHAQVLVGGVVVENPHYLTPGYFMAETRSARRRPA